MKKKIRILVVVLLIAAAGAYAALSQDKANEEGAITAYGNVEIREVNLGFRVSGRISGVLKDEGDYVEANAVLAVIDPEPLNHQLSSLIAQKKAAEAEYELLVYGYRKEDIDKAKANLDFCDSAYREAVVELARQKQLQVAEAGRKQDYDRAISASEQAEAQLSGAKAEYEEYKSGFRIEEIAKAKAQVEQLDAEIAKIQLQLDDAKLQAPSRGTILTRAVEKGSIVSVGQAAFVLSLDDEAWVRAYIPQTRLGEIEPGMPVEVYSDSRPDQPYQGHIGFISSKAEFTPKYVQTEDLRSDLVYRFRIIVDGDTKGLRQGMPVTVKLSNK